MAQQQPTTRGVFASRLEWCVALGLTAWVLCLHIVYMFHAGPLWRDECGTIAFANMPYGEMWDKIQYDNFPPFFEWLVRPWSVYISSSDFGYRVLGLIVGVLTLGIIWFSARLMNARTPLFALAFYALNPLALRVGDSMRPYGLGFALVMLTLGLVWKFVEQPKTKWFVAATASAVLTAQCMYQNAFYIAAFVLAAWRVCWWNKNRKRALYCLGIGAIAALFLLIHVPNILKGEQSRDIARVPVSKELIGNAFVELLSAATKFMVPIYVVVLGASLVIGLFVVFKQKRQNVVYVTLVFLLATIFQIGLLVNLGLPPRSWYFLIWLAPMALCTDVIWSALKSGFQIARVGVALLVAVLCLANCWAGAKLRQTNIDLIAAKLKAERKPDDLVLAAPWFNGVSLYRYYPQDQFVTLPPMEEIRIHRYDMMKRAMQSTDPIGGLANQIAKTLQGGHTLWIVGSLKFPKQGETVPQYPPYHKGIGINDAAYYFSWSEQLGKLIQEHATKGDVVNIPAPAEINSVENLTLIAVSGWHD